MDEQDSLFYFLFLTSFVVIASGPEKKEPKSLIQF